LPLPPLDYGYRPGSPILDRPLGLPYGPYGRPNVPTAGPYYLPPYVDPYYRPIPGRPYIASAFPNAYPILP